MSKRNVVISISLLQPPTVILMDLMWSNKMSSHTTQVQWTLQNLNTEHKAWTHIWLNKFQVSRIFVFSTNPCLIIFANDLLCFSAVFPLLTYITDIKSKHKFTPNLLMLSNKHLTYPLCDEVTGTEENELTKGGTEMCCLHWFWFMKEFCQ